MDSVHGQWRLNDKILPEQLTLKQVSDRAIALHELPCLLLIVEEAVIFSPDKTPDL